MTITQESTVGRVAAEHPSATRVFARHGIDFCCGGGKPLAEACAKAGIDTERVLTELRDELASPSGDERRWDDAPLDELIDHILADYHEPLAEELPRLESMLRKVVRVHRDKQPERLPELLSVYVALVADLRQHMAKEEEILFPAVRAGHGSRTRGPVACMEQEHEAAGAMLRRIRELTDDFTPPEEACTTWRALWHGLAELEGAMHRHIHLENNILFPRALEER